MRDAVEGMFGDQLDRSSAPGHQCQRWEKMVSDTLSRYPEFVDNGRISNKVIPVTHPLAIQPTLGMQVSV